jgi:mannonate dehydratase
MRLASVLTPLSDYNLQLAAQVGVTDIVTRCPGPDPAELAAVCERVRRFGLRVSVIEGYLPIENSILGNVRRDAEIEEMKGLLRSMAASGVHLCCYNWMAGTDWVRTRLDAPERGGALVTAFDLAEVERAVSLTDEAERVGTERIEAAALWENLEYFLRAVLPEAEACGVTLAMHPDDPPLPEFLGRARIMHCVEGFERLVRLVPSPRSAICFCQGTFAEMGEDIPAAIRRLGPHIRYVHFRDVRGTAERFAETFHDNGPTDMAAAMRAYREIGFDGPMRPDHVPQLAGEEDGPPGYTMLGRLFAFGYMRGLMHGIEASGPPTPPDRNSEPEPS